MLCVVQGQVEIIICRVNAVNNECVDFLVLCGSE